MDPNELITKKDLFLFEERMLSRLKEISQELQNQVNSPTELLRSREMKKMIKVSDNTLRSLRESGILPYIQLGGIYLYPYDKIIKLLKNNTINK